MSEASMQIRCTCGTTLKVPKTSMGGKVRCPKCSTILRVPSPADVTPTATTPPSNPPTSIRSTPQPPLGEPSGNTGRPPQNSPPQNNPSNPFGSTDFSTNAPAEEFDFGSLPSATAPAGFTSPVASSFATSAPSRSPLNPYQSTSTAASGASIATGGVGANASEIRQEYLSHEASVRSIGTLYMIGSVFGVLASLLMLMGFVIALFAGDAGGGPDGIGVGVVLVFTILFFAINVFQVFLALGLRRLQNWARITAGVFSVPGLLGVPVGTIISAYFLYILFSRKGAYVCSEEYHQIVAATPHIKYKTPVLVWVFAGLIVLLIGVAIVASVAGA